MLKTFLQDNAVYLCKKKKRVEKAANIRKMRRLKIEDSQKWPQSKGYRLCKIVTLSQKLKRQKKKDSIMVFTRHCSCSMGKTAKKNS